MKRYQMLIPFIAVLFMFSFNPYAFAKSTEKTLLEYFHDVTGDGVPEKITVFGIPFDNNSAFYNEIWAVIEIEGKGNIRIDYEGGYEPKLEFADLNHDGIDDILYSSATGGSGGLYNYALHTVKDSKLQEIPLPTPLQIDGMFQNDFKAIVTIPGIEKPIILDLSSRKSDYIQSGLYQANGQLNEPTELMIDPIAMFEIIDIENKKGKGLKSFRQISGAYHADRLGTVETKWYYENGKWLPVNVEWK